jgi:hypothetical protein
MADQQGQNTKTDDIRESGKPGGGQGRVDRVESSGVYPVSEMGRAAAGATVHGESSFGQGERGAAGYQDAGGAGIIPDSRLTGRLQEEHRERHFSMTFPELALLAATRGIAGVGIGLLLSNLISAPRRKIIGLTLFSAGALSTVPIMRHLFVHNRR